MLNGERHQYKLGVIGNCSFLAYVDLLGDIQWLCLPRFDSDPMFYKLLDRDNGGHFSLVPETAKALRQYYRGNTNILCTDVEVEGGQLRITDFAPRFVEFDRHFKPNMLFRKIEPISGHPRVLVSCQPSTGKSNPRGEMAVGSNHIRYTGWASPVRLTTSVSLTHIMEGNSFVLSGPQYLVFSYGPPLEAPIEDTTERFLQKTIEYWEHWIKSTSISSLFQAAVIRSALILKLHQFEDTGAIIASGTTSLPESPGSGRTWDYRYCWMRDSYYTLRAFAEIGHFDETERFFYFIQDIVSAKPSEIAPLFTVAGHSVPLERLLDWPGYQNNQPVRVGNAAGLQRQFDVFGQILVSMLPLYTDRRLSWGRSPIDPKLVRHLIELMLQNFDTPDAGIWEYRKRQQTHCYTYLFHWAGANAAHRLSAFAGDIETCNLAAKMIGLAEQKIENCYLPDQKKYAQAIGNQMSDASTLQLITMGYLDGQSTKAQDHLRALERDLAAPNGLFFRYHEADDFGKPDTAFLATAFWRAEALACVGRITEAKENIEQLLDFANHLGLFSEDIGMDGSQWGNFPQTYSHVGLMNAVSRIARKLDKPFFLEDIHG